MVTFIQKIASYSVRHSLLQAVKAHNDTPTVFNF